MQRRCAHDGCRGIALRHSQFCRLHDTAWRQKRLDQIRTGKRRPTPAEAARLFRADWKARWQRNPWWPGATIWLAPNLEATFVEDIHRAGLSLSGTAPLVLNTLRWAWRRSRLNHQDPAGWQRAVQHAKRKQQRIGDPPPGYAYTPPNSAPPWDQRIKVVVRAATAYEPARKNPVVDRATRTRQRRQKATMAAQGAGPGPDAAPPWRPHQIPPIAPTPPVAGAAVRLNDEPWFRELLDRAEQREREREAEPKHGRRRS
jgi:hypothetical protein